MIALAWVALAMAATVGLIYVFQRSLIYLPSQAVPAPPQGVEQVSYETEDGLTLAAWFVRSDADRARFAAQLPPSGLRLLPLDALAQFGDHRRGQLPRPTGSRGTR